MKHRKLFSRLEIGVTLAAIILFDIMMATLAAVSLRVVYDAWRELRMANTLSTLVFHAFKFALCFMWFALMVALAAIGFVALIATITDLASY